MFSNATELSAAAVPYQDERGAPVVVVIAKATYEKRRGKLAPAEEPSPVRIADVPEDADAMREKRPSSLRYAADLGGEKPGADILITGSAVSARPVPLMDVAVRVPGRSMTLRIHGERLYYKSAFGIKIAAAVPFERAPVTFERAFGGTSADGSVIDWRNPAGRGAHKSVAELDGAPAPCVEDPNKPVEPGVDSVPVGLGPIAMWWLPRRALAGTMDAAWENERMPLPPLDFDRRFHHVAPQGLQLERPLREGDVIATHGLCEEGLFDVAIPKIALTAHCRFERVPPAALPLTLDTAHLEPSR